MRLLHTADLHLDGAFCAYATSDAEAQREEGRELLKRIFHCAREENCDLILIAGDLFDGKFVSPESEQVFCALISECGIPVVISPGNHDPYTEGGFYAKVTQRLPDGLLNVFNSTELQMIELESIGVRVWGYAFTSQSLIHNPISSTDISHTPGYLDILCAHTAIDTAVSKYAPVTLAQISACGFDYAALGHVHNVKEQEDSYGRIRYSGFAQGRAFDELGRGGVWIVDLDNGNIESRKIDVSKKAFYCLDVALSAEDGMSEAVEKIRDTVRAADLGEGVYLRLYLDGVADDEIFGALKQNESKLCEKLGLDYLELIDRTVPMRDGAYLERDTSLRGELYRTLLPKLMSTDPDERELALKALRIGLAAIDGKSITRFGV